MKTLSLLTVFLFAGLLSTHAQLSRQWVNTYPSDDSAYVETIGLFDAGGGNVIAASVHIHNSPPAPAHAMLSLQKVSPAGTLVWQQEYEHPVYEYFYLSKSGRDAAGNLYFAGQVTTGGATGAWFVVSFDDAGQFRWKKEIVENIYNEGYSRSLAVTPSGNVYAGGVVSAGPNSYGVIVKYDTDGNELWVKKELSEYGYAWNLNTTANGDVIAGHNDFEILRVNAVGTQQWSTQDTTVYGAPEVVEGADGGIYALAFAAYGYTLKKLSAAGNAEWTYDDFAPNWVFGDQDVSITTDPQGNVYIAGIGSTDDTVYTTAAFKFSPQGQQLWRQTFSDPAIKFYDVSAMLVLPSGNIAVSGPIWDQNAYGAGTAILDGGSGNILDSDSLTNLSMQRQKMVYNSSGLFVAGGGSYSSILMRYALGTVSVNEPVGEGLALQVFPNPFTQSVTLKADWVPQRYELFNMAGQCVAAAPLNGNTFVDLSRVPAGTYAIRVFGDGETVAVRKLVKH